MALVLENGMRVTVRESAGLIHELDDDVLFLPTDNALLGVKNLVVKIFSTPADHRGKFPVLEIFKLALVLELTCLLRRVKGRVDLNLGLQGF